MNDQPSHLKSVDEVHSTMKLMIVAGEASGERHGAALARSIKRLFPKVDFELFGSGGEEMRAAEVETLVDVRDIGIIGIDEVIRAFGRIYGAYRKLLEAARQRRPSAIVLIDFPDFNMALARRLRREGFKIIYYISPQVWAWRQHRTKALNRDVARMLVILPFEEEFYRKAGIEVEYVGHPLVEEVKITSSREDFIAKHKLDANRPIIALLPGSRRKEIHYHLPAMLDAAARLARMNFKLPVDSISTADISNLRSNISDVQFVLPLASTVDRSQVENIFKQSRFTNHIDITLIERDTYNALGHSLFAVVASGTATVETALTGTPMVIIYRASTLNHAVMRPLIEIETFGMVNLIAGRSIVSELIQFDVTGEKIANEVVAVLSDASRYSKMKEDIAEVRSQLESGGGPGADRAARAVMEVALSNSVEPS